MCRASRHDSRSEASYPPDSLTLGTIFAVIKTVPIKPITPSAIRASKGGEPIVCLTSYTAPMARLVPHVDPMLVGDSLAMTVCGMVSSCRSGALQRFGVSLVGGEGSFAATSSWEVRRIAAVRGTSGIDGERLFSATHGGPSRLRYDRRRTVGPDEVSKMSTTPDNTLADPELALSRSETSACRA